jgi:putative transposase
MARPLRIEYPGALYHLTSRGDRQEDIFLDDPDREAFLSVFGSVVERVGWRVYAYCLMDNHYHLMVETPKGNLSKDMRQLNAVYTQAQIGQATGLRYSTVSRIVVRQIHARNKT